MRKLRNGKKYIAILLAGVIITLTMASSGVRADSKETMESPTTTMDEKKESVDTVEEISQGEDVETNSMIANQEAVVGNKESSTSEEASDSNQAKEEEDNKEKEDNKEEVEKEVEKKEIIEMTTDTLSETVSDLYSDVNLDSTATYATKTLIVISDHSEFESFNAKTIINFDNMYILQYETEEDTKQAYKKLKKDESIGSVEIDALVEAQIEGEIHQVQSTNTKSDLALFLESKKPSKEVKVAILDTGINASDEDFKDNLINLGINLSTSGEEGSIQDDNGHGTDIAKIILNNSYIKLMPIKVANADGKATVLNTYLGIQKAIENNANVINISMNAFKSNNSQILTNIIDEATNQGILVVVSAGNTNLDVANITPANIESAIVVSAVNDDNTFANYSNYGDTVDYSSYGTYEGKTGTSYAAANVTGIIADLLSKENDISILNEYAIDLGEEGYDSYFGNGLLSLYTNMNKEDVTTDDDKAELIQRNKRQYEELCNMDWKSMSDSELSDKLLEYNVTYIGYFLLSLSEDDLALILSKDTILQVPVETGKVYQIKENSEADEITKSAPVFYEHLYEAAMKKANEMNISDTYNNTSGHFDISFKGGGITSYKMRIDFADVSEPSKNGTYDSVGGYTFYITDKSKNNVLGFRIDGQLYVRRAKDWSGIYVKNALFIKIPHTFASESDNAGNGGRLWTNGTLDTFHADNDGMDYIDIECNAYNCGLQDFPDNSQKFYYRTLTITFSRYQNTVNINPNGGSYGGATTITKDCGNTTEIGYPTRQGYVFTGWTVTNGANAAGSLNGTTYTHCTKTTSTTTTTLTANWALASYRQIVRVWYENPDTTWTSSDVINADYNYGSTVSWSTPGNSVYEANSISYIVESPNTKELWIGRKSNPSASYTIQGTLLNGWYKGIPNITFTGSDPNLHISSVTVNGSSSVGSKKTISAEEGIRTYSYYTTNIKGVNSQSLNMSINSDNSKPVHVSVMASKAWTNEDLPLLITGQDIHSGLASFQVYYSENSIGWSPYGKQIPCNGEVILKQDSTSIKADKNGYYKVIATDRVGFSTESSVIQINNIDMYAPTLAYTIDGDLQKNDWYKGDSILNLTASDTGGSGVKSITVNNNATMGDKRSVDVTSEGENVYICIATDNAGNPTDPPQKITVKVDKSSPINLSMTPSTTEWTKDPITITAKAEDKVSGVDMIELQYTADNKNPNWQSVKTESLSGAKQAAQNFSVTANGFYRLVVTDQVGFQTITKDKDILKITNYDPDLPDSNTIGIEPDTIQWVDEPTGVEVTSFGSDELSGLSTVEVMEYNGYSFESKKEEKYNGETTLESASYDTHINERYKTRVTDQAGNKLVMKDEEALAVDNIDPQAPELTIESVSSKDGYISTTEGYVISGVIEDNQSGIKEVVLQKLNENGEWEDYKAEYQIIETVSNDSKDSKKTDQGKLEKYGSLRLTYTKRDSVMVAAANLSLASSKQAVLKKEETRGQEGKREKIMAMVAANLLPVSSKQEVSKEERKQGEKKVIIEYKVRENGTYRLKGADLVENEAVTKDTIEVTNLDGSMPVIEVDGNPTIWQNTDATIKVTATDADTKIVKMILDGKEQVIKENGSIFSFTFDVTKNQEFTVTASDEAGNTTTELIKVTKIDKTVPILLHQIEGDLQKSGWYKGDVTLSLSASDEGGSLFQSIVVNGVETNQDTKKITINEGISHYNGYATDYAGNKSTPPLNITLQVDQTAPINLSITPNTKAWINEPVKLLVKAEDTQSGVETIELQYTNDKKDKDSWKTYQIESFSGASHAEKEIAVTDNGYYRIVVTDCVGYQTTTKDKDILSVTNYDPDLPDETQIGIKQNTIQWVNKETGVEITSFGADLLSGLKEIAVQEYQEDIKSYQDIKVAGYQGETSLKETSYVTHQNGSYLTRVTDQANNTLRMPQEKALEVDNIDPNAPELTMVSNSPTQGYISTTEGYVLHAVMEDNQSGFGKIALQKLNENGEWEDYKAEYQIIKEESSDGKDNPKTDQEKLENENEFQIGKSKRERVIVLAAANLSLASSKQEVEERKQGEKKVIIEYKVRENGTYRLKGADLVENEAVSNDTIEVTNLDGSMPVIEVEGNPTIWQNTDATIQVKATDADSKITKMTLDGDEKAFQEGDNGVFYFTFDATKNQEFTVTATDEAGNMTTEVIKVTKIDKEAPMVKTDIKKSWLSMLFGDARNLTIDSSDHLSGIKKITVTFEYKEVVLSDYAYEKAKSYVKETYKIKQKGTYQLTVTDQAGNVTTMTIAESNLDFSAPWLKVEGNPTIWQNIDATITVTASDEDSSIKKMTLDGEEQEIKENENKESYFTFTVSKNQTFLVTAYDEADHITAQEVSVTKIDKEKPSMKALLASDWHPDGYRNLAYAGADQLSGIAEITVEHGDVKETLVSFSYDTEQKKTADDYHIKANGDYRMEIKDYAGNKNTITVSEAEAKVLKAMEVVVPPDKTKYKETENFKKAGMVVDAIYKDNSRSLDIKDYIIINGTNLPLAQEKIDLSYTEGGATVYTNTPIKVQEMKEVSETPEIPSSPEIPEEPTPLTPVPFPVSPTVEEEITQVEEKEKEVITEEEPVKEIRQTNENTEQRKEKTIPIAAILTGAGFFFLVLFLLLSNVKIYSKTEEGEWRFLGKTRALKAKEKYMVRISKLVRIRAMSNSYKLVFSKMFQKFHEDCELVIKIDQQEYEKTLSKESDTVYVNHSE